MSLHPAETVIDVLDNSAELYPQRKVAFFDLRDHGTVLREASFSDVAELSKRYASGLQCSGVQKGDRVGLLLPSQPEFIFAFIGAIRAGAVAVPLPTYSGIQSLGEARQRFGHIIQRSSVQYLVTGRRMIELLQDSFDRELLTSLQLLTPEELDLRGEGVPFPVLENHDLCLIQYTSGSLTAPKGVALTHRNILSSLAATGHGIQVTDQDVYCSWLPLYHDMGLMGMLCAITYGASQYVCAPRSFVGNPWRFLREFSRFGATVYTGPNFSFAHMLTSINDQQLEELDLSRWRIAFNGGEPINPRTLERFIERFSRVGFRPQTMFPVYGLAEATVAVSFPKVGSSPLIQWIDGDILADERRVVKVDRSNPRARGIVSVGQAVLGHTLRVVDPGGIELPEDCVGEVHVRGPSVMVGYYADHEQSEEVLRDGWLSTGDLGYVSDGQLFITGRSKEMIIVNGRQFYPQDVEQLIASSAGVHRGGCIALGDADGYTEYMVVGVETKLRDPDERSSLANNLRSLISSHIGLFGLRIYLLKPGGLPQTSSGKYQRQLFRDLLRGGMLEDKLWPGAQN